MSVFDVDNPRIGIRIQEASGTHSVLRLPCNESLHILPKKGMMELFDALVVCKSMSRTSIKRGESRRIFGDGPDGGSPMYSSIGVQVSRFGGVITNSPCFSSLANCHWCTIVSMTRRAEAAFESFADTSALHQLTAATQVVDFKTLSTPDGRHSVKYFGAIAFGRNVFLRCHTDHDFTFSITQIFLMGSDRYSPCDQLLHTSAFPPRGLRCGQATLSYLMRHFPTVSRHVVTEMMISCARPFTLKAWW